MRFMRIRVTEILKFLVAVAIGFTLRVMIESIHAGRMLPDLHLSLNMHSSETGGAKDQHEFATRASDDYDEQLREQYVPHAPDDVIEYRFFNNDYLYDIHRAVPRSIMKKHQRVDIKDILKAAKNILQTNGHQDYSIYELRNGYVRIDPLRGKEYLLDMEVSRSRNSKVPRQRFRLSLVKPFDKERLVARSQISAPSSETVHVLLPVTIEESVVILSWVDNFARNVYLYDKFVVLNVILFYKSTEEKALLTLEKQLLNVTSRYGINRSGGELLKIVRTSHQFSPHFGKNLGSSSLPLSAPMVFADLTVNFTSDFFTRCRLALQHREIGMSDQATASRSVYVPIPFSVYHVRPPSSDLDVTSDHGFWNHESYEIFCLTKATYRNAGVFDIESQKSYSMNENKALYARLVSNKIPVLRSADPAVFVNYSSLSCAHMDRMWYMTSEECQNSQLRSYGSRLTLAKQLLLSKLPHI